jgi:hypothetical protein
LITFVKITSGKKEHSVFDVTCMARGLELIDQRPAGNTYAILFDSMYAANVVEGSWKARTNIDAVARSAALLEEVRRSNDVRLIHVNGHSADGGNDRVDELAWWGKEGPPVVLPTPATRRRRGEPARTGGELRGARGAARGGEGGGCTSGRCCRRCRGGCTSGRCDGKRCEYGGRGCWRSHPRNGRCG